MAVCSLHTQIGSLRVTKSTGSALVPLVQHCPTLLLV